LAWEAADLRAAPARRAVASAVNDLAHPVKPVAGPSLALEPAFEGGACTTSFAGLSSVFKIEFELVDRLSIHDFHFLMKIVPNRVGQIPSTINFIFDGVDKAT